jgi:hypothetical protein
VGAFTAERAGAGSGGFVDVGMGHQGAPLVLRL